MKVLFCTDGSKISFSALENFAKWHQSAVIDIICVIDWSFLPDEVYIEESGFADSCSNIACTILERAKSKVRELGLILNDSFRVCGGASDSIAEQLDRLNKISINNVTLVDNVAEVKSVIMKMESEVSGVSSRFMELRKKMYPASAIRDALNIPIWEVYQLLDKYRAELEPLGLQRQEADNFEKGNKYFGAIKV